jgi:membrane protein DedA with SNARE-associated domain
MRDFLSTYGLWAAFLLALLENDVAFIAIGVVLKLGDGSPLPDELSAYTAMPAAIIGALLHDTGWFALGYVNSAAIKSSRVYRRIGPTVERLAERFGPWEIFIARFIYGTRNPSSVFWGVHHLPYAQFAGLELFALTIWGSLLALVGYHSTGWALKIIGNVDSRHHPHLLLIAIAIAFAAVWLLRIFNRRGIVKIQKKVEAREHAAELAHERPPSATDSEIR